MTDFIERQQAEIERLNAAWSLQRDLNDGQAALLREKAAEVERLREVLDHIARVGVTSTCVNPYIERWQSMAREALGIGQP